MTIFRFKVLLVILVFVFIFTPRTSSANPEVISNPEHVRYEGSGGLILPESINSATRKQVAECRGCSWKMTPACIPGADTYCDALIRSCPGLLDHVRTWFRPLGGDWIETGLMCLSSTEIPTVAEVDREVRSSFEQYVPDLTPQCWPQQRVITQIPLVCSSGQTAQVHRWRHDVAGSAVTVSALPKWVWNFNGTSLITNQPGGKYPDSSVAFTFERHGRAEIGVQSVWSGTFTVGDLGPFEIREDLRQHRGWSIDVGEARGRLIRPTA